MDRGCVSCRLCGSDRLVSVLDLGATPPCERFLSADELDAYNLIEQAREWVLKLPGKGRGVHAVDIAGEPARRDDIESGTRRFVMTVDVVMRSNP